MVQMVTHPSTNCVDQDCVATPTNCHHNGHIQVMLATVFIISVFVSMYLYINVSALLHCYVLKIIDSIMALFRVDFSGRGELADRQQKLAQMLSRLQKISEGSCLSNYHCCQFLFTMRSLVWKTCKCQRIFTAVRYM